MRTLKASPARTWVLMLIAAAVLAVGSFVFGRWSASSSDHPPVDSPVSNSVRASDVGPTDFINGIPVGYARSKEGAVQAALNYTRALGPGPGESRARYATKLRQISSSEWNDLETTINSWSDDEAEAAPIRVRISGYSSDEAEVAVWFASFVNPRNGAVGSLWGRAFLRLVWEEGDWKLASQDGASGPWPRPLSEPSSDEAISQLVGKFNPIEYEPSSIP